MDDMTYVCNVTKKDRLSVIFDTHSIYLEMRDDDGLLDISLTIQDANDLANKIREHSTNLLLNIEEK